MSYNSCLPRRYRQAVGCARGKEGEDLVRAISWVKEAPLEECLLGGTEGPTRKFSESLEHIYRRRPPLQLPAGHHERILAARSVDTGKRSAAGTR